MKRTKFTQFGGVHQSWIGAYDGRLSTRRACAYWRWIRHTDSVDALMYGLR